jgi:hypothetical protein
MKSLYSYNKELELRENEMGNTNFYMAVSFFINNFHITLTELCCFIFPSYYVHEYGSVLNKTISCMNKQRQWQCW